MEIREVTVYCLVPSYGYYYQRDGAKKQKCPALPFLLFLVATVYTLTPFPQPPFAFRAKTASAIIAIYIFTNQADQSPRSKSSTYSMHNLEFLKPACFITRKKVLQYTEGMRTQVLQNGNKSIFTNTYKKINKNL